MEREPRARHRARRRPRRQRRAALPPPAPLPAGRRPRSRRTSPATRCAPQDLPGDDPDTVRLRRRAVGRVPDGRRLAADLLSPPRRRRRADLTSRAAGHPRGRRGRRSSPPPTTSCGRGQAAVSEPRPGAPSAWRPNRLEHAFAVQADLPGGRVVLARRRVPRRPAGLACFTAAGQPSSAPRPPRSRRRAWCAPRCPRRSPTAACRPTGSGRSRTAPSASAASTPAGPTSPGCCSPSSR